MKTSGEFPAIIFRKGGKDMDSRTIELISDTIHYIEANLYEKLDLEKIADAVHCSKYHLHRRFTDTVGLTIHDYVQRRQLTEAAKLLVFTKRPILEIALGAGYESQQAFSSIFREMYKMTPARYRKREEFYPLQLEYVLKNEISEKAFYDSDIRFAVPEDIPGWMELVRLVVDGYPHLEEKDYEKQLASCILKHCALLLREGPTVIGAMIFSRNTGSIDFLGVHPQYRKKGIAGLFLKRLVRELPDGKEISITTFRVGDKADTDWREVCQKLGFTEGELLTEYGYPTQRFILSPGREEVS